MSTHDTRDERDEELAALRARIIELEREVAALRASRELTRPLDAVSRVRLPPTRKETEPWR